jgi:hypothetical protein
MQKILATYSDNWKKLGTVLTYKSNNFNYLSSVIITELDDCIIPYITPNKLYDKYNKYEIDIHEDLIKELKKATHEKSIIIISNQNNSSKLVIDIIKRKVDAFLQKTGLQVLVLCALNNNKFAKPHTGMWRLLKMYYKMYGHVNIKNATVVSDEGGLITEKVRKNGDILSKIKCTDVDRAFAHNISAHYQTIDEFLLLTKHRAFKWSSDIIDPDIRELYCKEITNYMFNKNDGKLDEKSLYNTFIFKQLAGFKNADTYVIILLGPPRSGKTTVANKIISKWRNSTFGESHSIERLALDTYSKSRRFTLYKKYLLDRISVIIDGDCHLSEIQDEYVSYAKELSAPILFVDVNPGIEMAKVLNHVCVEESTNDKVILYKSNIFDIYKSIYRPPKVDNYRTKYIWYCPVIEYKDTIMKYRY